MLKNNIYRKMDQAPNLEMVYLAVTTLYNNPDHVEKEKASRWLEDLQKSMYSWNIADQMLQDKRDLGACYFASQTMRTKIQLSFHELPVESHISLRDSLLNHINQVNDGTNAIIVIQLCLAVADCALHMSTWNKPILDLINRFSQTHLWPLLEIMTVLPEELESKTVRLGSNRRIEVLEDLKSCAPTVLEFLRVVVTNSGDNVQIIVKVIRCFTSWISVQAILLADISDNAVVAKSFQILSDHNKIPGSMHEAATDCICTLLQCLEDNNNQQNLEMQLYQNVVALEQPYHMSVANEDQEKSINYCRIFTELGETFLDKIITKSNNKSQHFAIKILDLILICVGHHDYEVAEITFNLWYRLSEELYQKNCKGLTELFRPYIERLVTALCRHAQMEPDQEGLLESGDEFKDFRSKVCDIIKDVVFIVGSCNCFRQMFMNLQAPNVTWDASEAALFIMYAVAKNILPEENEVVPKVVEAILNLPENTHIAVRYTSVLLLGELCEWIEKHPASIEPVLNFLLYSIQQRGIAPAAAAALQNVCSACRNHMSKHIPVLVQLLHQIDSLELSSNSIIGILKGVSDIINCMSFSEIPPALREICLLQVKPLCQLIEQDVVVIRGTKTDPTIWLDRLSAIFRTINLPVETEVHPCRDVITEVWPVLSSTFNKYQSDLRIIERCCRCVRFTIRCLNKQGVHLLEPLVKQMVLLYRIYKHSCYLYLGSILVDEFAQENDWVQGLLDMLQAFIEPTFTLLKEENGLRNHPDTVDDFFRLCARFLQRSPILFLQCSALPSIFQCALLSCTLDHKEANTSVMKFFYDLLHCRSSHNSYDVELQKSLVISFIKEYGQQLVTSLLHASVFYLHTYMMPDIADVFIELMTTDREAVGKWLENALQSLQNHSTNVHVTQQQLVDFHISVLRSDTSKSVSNALKDLHRLYH